MGRFDELDVFLATGPGKGTQGGAAVGAGGGGMAELDKFLAEPLPPTAGEDREAAWPTGGPVGWRSPLVGKRLSMPDGEAVVVGAKPAGERLTLRHGDGLEREWTAPAIMAVQGQMVQKEGTDRTDETARRPQTPSGGKSGYALALVGAGGGAGVERGAEEARQGKARKTAAAEQELNTVLAAMPPELAQRVARGVYPLEPEGKFIPDEELRGLGQVGLWESMVRAVNDGSARYRLPVVGAAMEFGDVANLVTRWQRLKAGRYGKGALGQALREQDRRAVGNWAQYTNEEAVRGTSWQAQLGGGILTSATWAAEMGLAGATVGGGKVAPMLAKRATKSLLEKELTQAAKYGLKAGWTLAKETVPMAVALAPVQMPKLMAEKMLPQGVQRDAQTGELSAQEEGKSLGRAAVIAALEHVGNVGTEMAGEVLVTPVLAVGGHVAGKAAKKVAGKLPDEVQATAKAVSERFMGALKRGAAAARMKPGRAEELLELGYFGSLAGEMGEERLQAAWNAGVSAIPGLHADLGKPEDVWYGDAEKGSPLRQFALELGVIVGLKGGAKAIDVAGAALGSRLARKGTGLADGGKEAGGTEGTEGTDGGNGAGPGGTGFEVAPGPAGERTEQTELTGAPGVAGPTPPPAPKEETDQERWTRMDPRIAQMQEILDEEVATHGQTAAAEAMRKGLVVMRELRERGTVVPPEAATAGLAGERTELTKPTGEPGTGLVEPPAGMGPGSAPGPQAVPKAGPGAEKSDPEPLRPGFTRQDWLKFNGYADAAPPVEMMTAKEYKDRLGPRDFTVAGESPNAYRMPQNVWVATNLPKVGDSTLTTEHGKALWEAAGEGKPVLADAWREAGLPLRKAMYEEGGYLVVPEGTYPPAPQPKAPAAEAATPGLRPQAEPVGPVEPGARAVDPASAAGAAADEDRPGFTGQVEILPGPAPTVGQAAVAGKGTDGTKGTPPPPTKAMADGAEYDPIARMERDIAQTGTDIEREVKLNGEGKVAEVLRRLRETQRRHLDQLRTVLGEVAGVEGERTERTKLTERTGEAATLRPKGAQESEGVPGTVAAPPQPSTLKVTMQPAAPAPAPVARKGRRAPVPNEEARVLQGVLRHGGIRPKERASNPGNEYDGQPDPREDAQALAPFTEKVLPRDGSGMAPDELAATLFNAGTLKENSAQALWDALRAETAAHRRAAAEEQAQDLADEQDGRFEAEVRQPGKGKREAVEVDSLRTGDVLTVKGERLAVTRIDPDSGAVTLRGGQRYGTQTVEAGGTVHPEAIERAPETGPAAGGNRGGDLAFSLSPMRPVVINTAAEMQAYLDGMGKPGKAGGTAAAASLPSPGPTDAAVREARPARNAKTPVGNPRPALRDMDEQERGAVEVPVLDAGAAGAGQPLRMWEEVKHWAGTERTNGHSGIVINVSVNALRHSLFREYSPDKGAAHRVLGDLLADAVYAESYPPTKEGDEHSIRAMHVFYGAVRVDGRLLRVRLKAKEFIDPNRGTGHYDLETVEVERAAEVTDAGLATRQSPVSTATAVTVRDLLREVNFADGTPVLDPGMKMEKAGTDGLPSGISKPGRTVDEPRVDDQGRPREQGASVAPTPEGTAELRLAEASAETQGAGRQPRQTEAQARALWRQMFGDDADLRFVDAIASPEGRKALGQWTGVWAEIVGDGADLADTALHEGVHKAEELLLSDAERLELVQAEPSKEKRAEGIVKYARDGQGLVGVVRRIADRLLRRMRAICGLQTGRDRLGDFYDALLAGGLKDRVENASAMAAIAYRTGDTFGEHSLPLDDVEPQYLDTAADNLTVVARGAAVVQAWPMVVTAADGGTVRLDNPEAGSLGQRVWHMMRHQDTRKLHPAKAAMLPNVPQTLQDAAVRIADPQSGNRIYVRAYANGDVHMVVVRPDGAIDSQGRLDSRLITQFPFTTGSRQEGFRVEWAREEKGEGRRPGVPNPTPDGSTNRGSRRPAFREEGTPGQAGSQGPATPPGRDIPTGQGGAQVGQPVLTLHVLVEMATRMLAGKVPGVMEKLRAAHGGALGVFRAGGDAAAIELRADIFVGPQLASVLLPRNAEKGQALEKMLVDDIRARNPEIKDGELVLRRKAHKGQVRLDVFRRDHGYVLRTLAHEVGHLADWLDDKTLGRGNILGHIAALNKYMAGMIQDTPENAHELISNRERQTLRRQAVDTVRRTTALDPKRQAKAFNGAVAKRYHELLAEAVKARGLVSRGEMMTELRNLSQWWKPFDVEGDAAYTQYRYKPAELYADAMSVLLNAPAELEARAPTFDRTWRGYLRARPSVAAAWRQVQEELLCGLDRGIGTLRRGWQEGFRRGDEAWAKMYEQTRFSLAQGWLEVRTALSSRAARLGDLVRQAAKAGAKVAREDNPLFVWANARYAATRLEGYTRAVYDEVIAPLKRANLPLELFDEYLLCKRVQGDRADLANPGGARPDSAAAILVEQMREQPPEQPTAAQADEMLAAQQGCVGPAGVAAFAAAAERLAELRNRLVVTPLERSGVYTADFIELMRTNRNYVHFDVVDYLDRTRGSGAGLRIHDQIGTLKEIASPLAATMMQDQRLLAAMLRNLARESTVKFLQQYHPELVAAAEMRWNGKGLEAVEPDRDSGRGLMTYEQDGQTQTFSVDVDVARMCQSLDTESMKNIRRGLSMMADYYRNVFVKWNPRFVIANPLRDVQRSLFNLPGMGTLAPWRLPLEIVQAGKLLWQTTPGNTPPLIAEMLERGALVTQTDLRDVQTLKTQTGRLLQMFGLGGLVDADRPAAVRCWHALRGAMERGAQFSERLNKVAAELYLRKYRPEMNAAERTHRVRSLLGTPDVLERGTCTWLSNSLVLFSNVGVQGLKSDVEAAMTDRTVMAKRLLVWLPYRCVVGALAYGLVDRWLDEIGDEKENRPPEGTPDDMVQVADPAYANTVLTWDAVGKQPQWKARLREAAAIYRSINPRDLANYFVIPYGIAKDTRKVLYWRLPLHETDRQLNVVLDGVLKEMMDGAMKLADDDTKVDVGGLARQVGATGADIAKQVGAYGADQMPTAFVPWISTLFAGLDVAAGNNPVDSWTHRPIIDRLTWEARGTPQAEVWSQYAQWAWQKNGMGAVYNLQPKWKRQEERDSGLPGVLQTLDSEAALGVINVVVGNFLKVSDRGIDEAMRRDELEQRTTEGAGISLTKSLLAARRADDDKLIDLSPAEEEVYRQYTGEIEKRAWEIQEKRGESADRRTINEAPKDVKLYLEQWQADHPRP